MRKRVDAPIVVEASAAWGGSSTRPAAYGRLPVTSNASTLTAVPVDSGLRVPVARTLSVCGPSLSAPLDHRTFWNPNGPYRSTSTG